MSVCGAGQSVQTHYPGLSRARARGYGLLGALVVGSINGLPREGFFELAARHGRVGDRRTLWKHELDPGVKEAKAPPTE
jgi:hypothetical protein